jgi:membrane-associated phospholipid phosphatase
VPRRSGPDHVSHLQNLPLEESGRIRDRLWFSAYYAIAFVILGVIVARRDPSVIDVAARPFTGHGVPIARLLTDAGLFPVYAGLSVILLIVGFIERRWLRSILVSIVALLAAWQISDACKVLFHRARPTYFVPGAHEASLSYPSGHTTLAIAFYGFWTAIAWESTLPIAAKRWIRIAFAVWVLAIGWSRLALGAHYLTDIVGGYLLGAAVASAAILVNRMLSEPEA